MFDTEFDPMSRPINSIPTRWERKAEQYADRFIPDRESLHGMENIQPNNNASSEYLPIADEYNSKILTYKQKAPTPSDAFTNNMRVLYTQNKESSHAAVPKKAARSIATVPEKILDAPNMIDDYYLNLLDFSAQNVLAVGLGETVYLWNGANGSIEELCTAKNQGEMITSLSFMADGTHIAIGTSTNEVQLWNVERKKQVRAMKGHQARVGSLAWNNHILSSGSRDANIMNNDVRIAQHHISTFSHHTQEICGLKWSCDGTQLASGGNDNIACIWDASSLTAPSAQPRHVLADSQAAVRALAWCPFQSNLLATGSGTADRHIRFYNTSNGVMQNSIDTNSQVCSLQWSKTEKEILSSHGFSQNQLTVWKYPTLAKVADLSSHSSRVLHTAVSPDGTTVVSAAADETLCFWKVWEPVQMKKKTNTFSDESRRGINAINIR